MPFERNSFCVYNRMIFHDEVSRDNKGDICWLSTEQPKLKPVEWSIIKFNKAKILSFDIWNYPIRFSEIFQISPPPDTSDLPGSSRSLFIRGMNLNTSEYKPKEHEGDLLVSKMQNLLKDPTIWKDFKNSYFVYLSIY